LGNLASLLSLACAGVSETLTIPSVLEASLAFNGSGVHNRVHDWTQDLANTIPVTASRMDAEHDDISAALSNCICRDGQSTTTARIPFAAGTSAVAGSTSSVAYAQTNDPNTGMYFPGVDQWGLAAGGTATLTSTSSKVTVEVAVDFDGTAAPTSSDGAALGSTTQMWSDLFLASGAVINFNNSDATLTHSPNILAFAGATVTFDTAPTPASSDGAALGTSSVMWSDLFLASGAVINFNNGDVTVTHSANTLAFVGATSGYTFDALVTAADLTASDDLSVGDDASVGGDLTVTGLMTGRIPLLHVRDEKANGTAGGTFNAGDWRTRDLNTSVTNEITGASLSSNQITLPAGAYFIDAQAPARGVGAHVAKLRNVTDGSDVIIGRVQEAGAGDSTATDSMVRGRFTIATQKVFELQHRSEGSAATSGFGDEGNLGVTEVYSDVMIWKVA
jgi:hypothetical protein